MRYVYVSYFEYNFTFHSWNDAFRKFDLDTEKADHLWLFDVMTFTYYKLDYELLYVWMAHQIWTIRIQRDTELTRIDLNRFWLFNDTFLKFYLDFIVYVSYRVRPMNNEV